MSRQANADDEIDGYFIPKDSLVVLCCYLLHRHKGSWKDPEKFDPERFAESAPEIVKDSYLPFGLGPRGCIGYGFAMMEMAIVLSTVLQKFKLQLAPGFKVEPEMTLTLRPKGGVMMTAEEVR
jgi:cytochrome P450